MQQKPDFSTSNSSAAYLFRQVNTDPGRVKRILSITALALINAIIVGCIAKLLVMLINFFTWIFFFSKINFHEISPADNTLGYWVIVIPVIGGLIVGVMARFGSRAIRGHGIPEAMEKIITDESKIHPMITILKPLSAAISIGSGGPFGAEGPIISTGGALGSFCGQTLHITAQERKVLLAAGATSGMTAIFGTPFAAILLAIELLLFEFSARSFIPVMIACITGACMHFLLFSTTATFPMPEVQEVDSNAVIAYAIMGVIMGFASILVTKSVYFIEDVFEKLPIHWMWWPALGGLPVGAIGVFAPKTLGVGYQNITDALSGNLSVSILISLCLWKFVSWAIALGSGTSGGTLAPLLTIGSSVGCLLGIFIQKYFPEAHVSLPLAALVGMAALFAGSARAILTSIAFAVETTMQESTLLPLIACCATSYLVSFIMMRSTIMTEKIRRRGVLMPESYHPDVLQMKTVEDLMTSAQDNVLAFADTTLIKDLRAYLLQEGIHYNKNVILVVKEDQLLGLIGKKELFAPEVNEQQALTAIMNRKLYTIYKNNRIQLALEFMLKTKQDILPVVSREDHKLIGVITDRDILRAYEKRFSEEQDIHQHISVKERTRSMLRKRNPFKKKFDKTSV
jgi:CIC family chloride channel protein